MNSAVGKKALRIVLFGRPGAGKSSLLGSLALAAEQPDSPWRLEDPSGGLAELRRRVEIDSPQPTITPEQVVPYPVRFQDAKPAGDSAEVLLIDCDGNAALQLLSAERFPSAHEHPGRLAQEISRADAILLVVPAIESLSEAPPGEEDFAQLERFLRLLEEDRGSAVHVGGLPVLLALTKCDLLARHGDTPSDWQARVAERLEMLDGRFQTFRAERLARGVAVFGQVSLMPAMATATHQPLTEPRQPLGVVDLFRETLALARQYRQSQRQSTGRLLHVALLLALLIAGLVMFGLHQGGIPSPRDQQTVRAAIEEHIRWFEGLKERGLELARFTGEYQLEEGGRVPWASWDRDVGELFTRAASRNPAPDEPLPGAQRATYRPVLADETVRQARAAWQEAAAELEQRRNLVAALGLVEPRPDRPALLKVPPPPDFAVDKAKTTWEQLARVYPPFRDWSLEGLPRGVAREIATAAESSVNHLLLAGQKEILWQLNRLSSPEGRETPALWRSLREWLQAPAELRAWRELTVYLLRLVHPAAEDPVDVLKSFLDRTQHEVELQRLVLRVPSSLKLTPAGKLTVYHGRKAEVQTTLAFKQLGEARREEGEPFVRYTFVPEAGESLAYRLAYRPGDTLWLDLPVQTGEKPPRMLTWSLCRSQVFQFERIVRSPRLHKPDQVATEGELMHDIALTVPVGIVPRLPELIPIVKLSRR
jgi:GTPase SAR1 family protein